MAQLSNFKSNKPIATDFGGVFVRNLPAKQLQDIFGNLTERLEKEPEVVIVELFGSLVCDENGDTFEDVGSYDAIMEVLSLRDIEQIMTAVAGAMGPGQKDLGK